MTENCREFKVPRAFTVCESAIKFTFLLLPCNKLKEPENYDGAERRARLVRWRHFGVTDVEEFFGKALPVCHTGQLKSWSRSPYEKLPN